MEEELKREDWVLPVLGAIPSPLGLDLGRGPSPEIFLQITQKKINFGA